MFLARLRLNRSRIAVSWAANPYRVHQRLQLAYEGDPRLLFRIEEGPNGPQILAQSQSEPVWDQAFVDFPVLLGWPECRKFEPALSPGQVLAFRLRANPTVKRDGKRLGLYREEEQYAWLERKAQIGGFRVLQVHARAEGMIGGTLHRGEQTHRLQLLAVQFDGVLQVMDSQRFHQILRAGIGSGKGLGFGLLSLARPS